MKTLLFVQKTLAMLGFSSNQPLCNKQFFTGFAVSCLSILSFSVFLLHEADTIKEFTNSIYVTAASVAIFTCFINTVFNRSKLTLFFEMLDENVNNSEYSYN